MTNKNTGKTIAAYTTLGIQIAVFMVLFVYGGYKIDVYFETSPLFVAVGAILGMGASLYNLLTGLRQMDKILKQDDAEEEKKTKWL
ncbi:MAG: AtpZ/AtpI family protein [Spirochaetota bacterium]